MELASLHGFPPINVACTPTNLILSSLCSSLGVGGAGRRKSVLGWGNEEGRRLVAMIRGPLGFPAEERCEYQRGGGAEGSVGAVMEEHGACGVGDGGLKEVV